MLLLLRSQRRSSGEKQTRERARNNMRQPERAPRQERSSRSDGHGRSARTPSDIPGRGWKDIAWRVLQDFSQHRILSLAAGVTYYALLAIFPAIAALVAIYGLFNDPASIDQQLQSLSGFLPGGAIQIVGEQVKALASEHGKTAGIAFVGGMLVSLWSASAGIKALFDALNVIYDESEKRTFLKLALVALIFTLGAIAFVVVGLVAIVAVPAILKVLGLGGALGWTVSLGRWPVLLIVIGMALAVIYRFGPSRATPKWRWVSWGSAFAAMGWLAISVIFSWYAANFGNFNATYGSLGGVIGLMTWLWLSATAILLGAQINAEIEHQTARDTTEGEDKPMGKRGAKAADTIGAAR
jgi:membrane protein